MTPQPICPEGRIYLIGVFRNENLLTKRLIFTVGIGNRASGFKVYQNKINIKNLS